MSIQQYNQTVQQYNQMKQMATAPQSAFTQYSNSGTQSVGAVSVPRQTPTGTPSPSSTQPPQAMVQRLPTRLPAFLRTGQISGYGNLNANGQQGLAATGATVDLGDAANMPPAFRHSEPSVRTRSSANRTSRSSRPPAIPPTPHSRRRKLPCSASTRRMLIQLRTQQETNEMMQAQAMQQIVSQKGTRRTA